LAVIRPVQTTQGKRHQVIVRKRGHSLSRVFWKIREAEDWARRCEDAIASATPERPFDRKAWLPLSAKEARAASFDDAVPHDGWLVSRALDKLQTDVTDARKGASEDGYRVKFWKAKLGEKELGEVTVSDIQAVIKERLAIRAGDTVRRETNVIRALFRVAKEDWKIPNLANLAELKLPSPSPHRERRLQDGHGDEQSEEDRLKAALATWKRKPEIHLDLFQFALETGLRLTEANTLRVWHIKRSGGICRIELPDSKNEDARRIVLSAKAQEIAERHEAGQPNTAKLFRISESARKRAWDMARKKAGVVDLRWHDLRHEAISRMASKNLHLGELMAQSGHRDVESVKRYTNARASDIKRKLG